MGKGNRNSQKRDLERQQNSDKLLAMQKSKGKKSMKDKTLAIVISIIALLIVAMLVLGALNNAGFFIRNQAAVKGETYTVDAAMISFLLNDHIMNWYSQYSGYLSMFSIDLSRDLRTQTYGDAKNSPYGYAYETYFLGSYDGTWYDYFMDTVKDEIEMYVTYAEAGKRITDQKIEDLSLSEDDKKGIEDILVQIRKSLAASNASYSDWYGAGVTESDARRCYELIYLAANFAEYYQEKLENEITEDEIVDYRENNKQLFYTADVLKYSISKNEKGMTEKEFDEACAAAKAAAEAIAKAKTPVEFVELIEKYEASLKETGKTEAETTETTETTETVESTETTETTETTESNTDTTETTETGTVEAVRNEAGNETESTETESTETEIDVESEDETESDLSEKFDKYKDTIEYITGTGTDASHKLNDFLFGEEEETETGSETGSETGVKGPAEYGDVTIIEEEGTVTETTSTTTANKKNVEVETTETSDTETGTETGTEAETDKKPSNVKTYETYKVTVYFVIDPMHFDTELTHQFAYFISDEKSKAFEFLKAYNSADKTLEGDETLADIFIEVAEKEYERIHNDKNHEHSDSEMFAFDQLKEQAAGVFKSMTSSDNYKSLDEWLENANRKDGEVSEIIELKIVTTDSSTNASTTSNQYAVLLFVKHNDETWHVSAFAGAVSEKFEEWYKDELETRPLEFDEDVLGSINTVKFY